ncbi:MAG: mannonate dehydratase [Acidimicrobiaceae bacterium]|jgi:mannonate dehydratase|nr:mannonate dehydratase [Acidimicrobiaceae bacterium]
MTIRVALGWHGEHTDSSLDYAVQLGVEGLIIHVPDAPVVDGAWQAVDLQALRNRVERHGLRLFSIENTQWDMYSDCMWGGPRADEQLAAYCRTVRNIGEAGIGVLGFCWMHLEGWGYMDDVGPEGRGGAVVRRFDQGREDPRYLIRGRVIGEAEMWGHFERFITTVAPVAEEAGVRLALHPDDVPIPMFGGIARIFSSFDGARRAVEEVCDSPSFGLNFCLGTWSEMSPAALDHMEHFAARDKIVYLHFRDVKGHVPAFEECFLGEGNYDPVDVLVRLRRTGFDGFLEEDHVPVMEGDTTGWGARGRAYTTGYIQGLLRAVEKLDVPR